MDFLGLNPPTILQSVDLFGGKSLFTGLPQKSKGCKAKNLIKIN